VIGGARRFAGGPLGRMAVIGLGQIGGSIALAAREAGAVSGVTGWSRTPETVRRAAELGIVDAGAPSAREAAAGAAVVVLATPVGSLGAVAAEIAPALAPGALVIDAGSVKARAIDTVEAALAAGGADAGWFVGCHPLAGTERFGPDAAAPELFRGRHCVICPSPRTRPEALALAERLWAALGAEPLRMEAALHDRVLGAASHLPHVAADALAGVLGGLEAEAATAAGLRKLPTTSLRDTTRVAASSPAMWRDIFLDNRAEVLPLIDRLQSAIAELRAAIESGDGARLEASLEAARAARGRIVPG
jgi:prephenate dehydrogenase